MDTKSMHIFNSFRKNDETMYATRKELFKMARFGPNSS